MKKIILVCLNYEPSQFPKEPDKEDRFYTYGFGGNMGKHIKNYLNDYVPEVWRLDGYVKKYYEKEVSGILHKVFPAVKLFKMGVFSLRFLKELKREVSKSDPIILVLHTHQLVTYQVAMLFKKSFLISSHHGERSPFFVYKNESGLRKIRALIFLLLEKLTMENVDYFLIRDYKEIQYLKKVSSKCNFIMYSNGVDLSRFTHILRTEAKKLLGWDVNKKYILYVGKLYKYKQVADLIKIWVDIKSQRPDVELVLIGNESPESWGEEYYNLAVNSGAMVLGRVLNVELYKYYSAADVYLLIALRDDYFGGTGIAALESLACNTPVVSYALRNYVGDNLSEIGEMPETLEGYKSSILKVLDSPEKYKNMRESIEKYYSHKAMSLKLDMVLSEVSKNEGCNG